MINRVGQMWDLNENLVWKYVATKSQPKRHRILVVESEDKGRGWTMQKFYYLRDGGHKGAYGEDFESGDFPWENRSERSRVA